MLVYSKKNDKISSAFYDHHEKVAEAFENLERFFELLFAENPDKHLLESAKLAIANAEAAADMDIRHVVTVMKDSFLPVTRKNMIALVQSTDSIANRCETISRQIWLEDIVIPEMLRHDILKIMEITKKQLSMLYTAIDMVLNDYKKIAKDRKILHDIREEESKVDNIEELLHERIFDTDITLTEKIYYRDLVEIICDLSDIIEDIADQISVILVEREV